jgi:mRNA interferase YafQ
MRQVIPTKQFKNDLKKLSRIKRYNKQDLHEVVAQLANDQALDTKYKDHSLSGNWAHYRECHIKPDWLLIYKKVEDDTLILARTGTHSELFG